MDTSKSTSLNFIYFSALPGLLKPIVFIEIIALLACFACVEYSPDGIYLSWVIVAASLIGILADSIYMLFGYAEIASFEFALSAVNTLLFLIVFVSVTVFRFAELQWDARDRADNEFQANFPRGNRPTPFGFAVIISMIIELTFGSLSVHYFLHWWHGDGRQSVLKLIYKIKPVA